MNYENSFLSPKLLEYAASLQMNDLRVECAVWPILVCGLILKYVNVYKRTMFVILATFSSNFIDFTYNDHK